MGQSEEGCEEKGSDPGLDRGDDAHEVVGKTVLYAIAQGKALEELTQEEYHELCPHIGPDVYEHISIERCVSARRELGGPAPESVQHSIAVLRQSLAKS